MVWFQSSMLAVPRQSSVCIQSIVLLLQGGVTKVIPNYDTVQVRYHICLFFTLEITEAKCIGKSKHTEMAHTQVELPEQVRQQWNRITGIQLSQNWGSRSFHGQRNRKWNRETWNRGLAASLLLLVPEGENGGSQMLLLILTVFLFHKKWLFSLCGSSSFVELSSLAAAAAAWLSSWSWQHGHISSSAFSPSCLMQTPCFCQYLRCSWDFPC